MPQNSQDLHLCPLELRRLQWEQLASAFVFLQKQKERLSASLQYLLKLYLEYSVSGQDKMIRLTIISKIPDNYGHIFRADISPEDKFDEVIERVATSANIPYEPRLFLKTDQGETVKKSAKVSFYLK